MTGREFSADTAGNRAQESHMPSVDLHGPLMQCWSVGENSGRQKDRKGWLIVAVGNAFCGMPEGAWRGRIRRLLNSYLKPTTVE